MRVDARQTTLLLVSTMTVMAGATVAPALPAIDRQFGDAAAADLWVRLVLTLPALFTALGAPLAGALIDRFGRLRLLTAAIALYGVGGVGGGLAPTLGVLLACRAALGLAVGGIMTTAVTLIADYYRGPDRGVVMGRQAAFMGFGGVVFLLAGGMLADLSWRAPFAVYGAAFVFLPLVLRVLDEPVRSAAGTGERPELPVPWGAVGVVYALAFVGMATFYLVPVQLPFYLEGMGVPATLVGAALAGFTLCSALASTRYGVLRAQFGPAAVFALLFAGAGAGFAVVAAASGYGGVVAGLVVAGAGFGLLMPNLNVWMSERVPEAVRGRVLGGLTTCLFLGQFFSPILAQPLVAEGLTVTFYAAGALLGGLTLVFVVRVALRRVRLAAAPR